MRMQWRTIFRDHGEAIKTSGSDLTSLRDKPSTSEGGIEQIEPTWSLNQQQLLRR